MEKILDELVEKIKGLPLSRQAALLEHLEEEESKPIDTPEACKLLGKSWRTVFRYIQEGTIPAKKVKGRWFFQREDIEDFLAGKSASANGGDKV